MSYSRVPLAKSLSTIRLGGFDYQEPKKYARKVSKGETVLLDLQEADLKGLPEMYYRGEGPFFASINGYVAGNLCKVFPQFYKTKW
ncbi:Stathmin Domain-Containing Protein 1 [Manis pentadactyla]|nr:Stathmin Domain-Containing Protein 1 [Manis pentadactyla]